MILMMGNDSGHIRCLQYEVEEQQLDICVMIRILNLRSRVSLLLNVTQRPLVVVDESATSETSSLEIKNDF